MNVEYQPFLMAACNAKGNFFFAWTEQYSNQVPYKRCFIADKMIIVSLETHLSLLRSVTARLFPKYEPTCSPGMMCTRSMPLSVFVPNTTEPLDSSLGDPVTTVYSSWLSSFLSSTTEYPADENIWDLPLNSHLTVVISSLSRMKILLHMVLLQFKSTASPTVHLTVVRLITLKTQSFVYQWINNLHDDTNCIDIYPYNCIAFSALQSLCPQSPRHSLDLDLSMLHEHFLCEQSRIRRPCYVCLMTNEQASQTLEFSRLAQSTKIPVSETSSLFWH